jgi:PAS domain S-box-containing protein
VVESAEDSIWSKTLDGVITSWNRAAEHLLGWRSSEVIGRSVYAVIPPDLHEQERDVLSRLARGEQVPRYESARLARDGRRVSLFVTISPIKDPTGRVVGASSIAREV